VTDRIDEYICGLYAREDALLLALREEADRSGLPPIAISPDTGRLLQVLMAAVGARRGGRIGAGPDGASGRASWRDSEVAGV
jgi:predicted O-methyltransferase YrrM